MIVILSGGTGGAKLIEGLAAEVGAAELTIICNTGDDCVFHGLNVSPDIDTILYTLAGLSDSAKGWGIKGDTFAVLDQLRCLGNDAWFNLGDKDFATHITRTRLLREGCKLSEVTDRMRRSLGVRARILPMSDAPVETRVTTPQGEISFQEFFVRERWSPHVTAVRFAGIEQSRPAAGRFGGDSRCQRDYCLSEQSDQQHWPDLGGAGNSPCAQPSDCARWSAVSPLIGAAAISGPAHKLMTAQGLEASAFGVAQSYREFVKTLVIAHEDQCLTERIQNLGIAVNATEIRMPSLADKRRLAREVLALAQK